MNTPSVTPYLTVNDAARAIAFYSDAFGAQEVLRLTEPGGRIGHAELQLGADRVYLADEFPEFAFHAPPPGGAGVTIALLVDDVDDVVARAVAAGAELVRPVKDEFYGERTGTLHDPFGHRWQVATRIETLSPEEMQRRYLALFGEGAAEQ